MPIDEKVFTAEAEPEVIERPAIMWNVIFYNDDFTPMDFVTYLLQKYFGHDDQTATGLMLVVHETGKAIVGTYPHGIAETKATFSSAEAHQEQHPLRVEIEPNE